MTFRKWRMSRCQSDECRPTGNDTSQFDKTLSHRVQSQDSVGDHDPFVSVPLSFCPLRLQLQSVLQIIRLYVKNTRANQSQPAFTASCRNLRVVSFPGTHWHVDVWENFQTYNPSFLASLPVLFWVVFFGTRTSWIWSVLVQSLMFPGKKKNIKFVKLQHCLLL